MHILISVDQNPYSACAVDEAARLAENTLANVTLLGVGAGKNGKDETGGGAPKRGKDPNPLPDILRKYRESFLGRLGDETSPEASKEFLYEPVELNRGILEELRVGHSARKSLKTRMRPGNPVKAILAEAREDDSDLIILGCSKEKMCAWEGGMKVPEKVVNDAPCSVLVVKAEEEVSKMVCCLDQDKTTQESLEMINQMVTLHKADLEIVGITQGKGLKADVEKKMDSILRYYVERQINPCIKLVPLGSLESFISEEARRSLLALWMGEKSVLEKVFPRRKVNRLIQAAECSVLMLR